MPEADEETQADALQFRRTDVLFGKLRPYLAKAWLAEFDGRCSSELLVLRPHALAPEFLRYWVLSREFVDAVDRSTYGTKMPRAEWDFIGNLPTPIPPLPHQRPIAAFLDRETARTDALIAKKERLLELLGEKRTALITRAVTKGLDPAVPMKESGVQWLGEVPAHWTCLPLSRISISRCDGPFGSGLKSEHYIESGVRVIRLQNIGIADFLGDDAAFIDPRYAAELGDHTVLPGDLLVAGLGDDRNPVGRACVAPSNIGRAMVKADCFRFRLDGRVANARFVAYQLSATARSSAGTMATGATRERVNLSSMATRRLALPPVGEQATITAHLDEEGRQLREVARRIDKAIALLREYRIALISAAVTGQIDVSGKSREA